MQTDLQENAGIDVHMEPVDAAAVPQTAAGTTLADVEPGIAGATTGATAGVAPGAKPTSLFRHRSFMFLWIGQFVAFLGNSVYSLALMWEMKELTGSTVMMSTVSIASLIPMLVLGPMFGVMVDRWSKRKAMIHSDIIRAVVIAGLTAVLATGHMQAWMLIAAAVINSSVGSIYGPANTALVPIMVGKDRITEANSLSQTATVTTQIIGPFVGGILVAHVSMTAAFLANAIGYLVSVVSLLCINYKEPTRVHRPLNLRQFGTELKEGFDAIRSIPVIRSIIPVSLIANFLFAPFDLVLIQYCTNILHGGAQLFGTMGTCFSVGMLLGALLSAPVTKKVRKGVLVTVAFPVMSLMMVGWAFTRSIWLALTLAAAFGLLNMLINIVFMTILQTEVPEEKMGRVSGSFGVMIQGAQPFAMAIGGYLLSIMTVPLLMGTIGVLQTGNALFAVSRKTIRQFN